MYFLMTFLELRSDDLNMGYTVLLCKSEKGILYIYLSSKLLIINQIAYFNNIFEIYIKI